MINWPHVGLYGEFSNCEEGMIEAINRNFFIIDNVMQMKVIDFVENLPLSPSQGDVYIVEDSSYTYTAGGSYLMIYNGESWLQIIPKEGFLAYVDSLNGLYWFNGEDWLPLPMSVDDIKLKLARATSTGVIDGLNLSITVGDDTKFDIAVGIYEIVDLSDVNNPVVKTIEYAGSTGNTVTSLATQDVTYISLDEDGVIHQSINFPTPNERRQYAFVGRLNHTNRTSISFADTFPDFKLSPVSSLYDLMDALAPFKMDQGLKTTPNGANLSFDVSAGKVFFRSDNYATDKNNPHTKTFNDQVLAPFRKMTQTSTVDAADVTVLEPSYYDVAGVRTLIAGGPNHATIQRIYKYKSGAIRVAYGQNVYTNMSAAREAVNFDSFVENPTINQTAVLIALVIITKGCTDLSDPSQCVILPASRFGSVSGGGGGGTGSGVMVVSDLTARNNIPEGTRTNGMLVEVISTDTIYKLIGLPAGATTTDANWDPVITGKATQVITNKDIDGGTASNTSRLTIPKGTYHAIKSTSRKEGTISFNTQDKKLLRDDGVNLNPIPVFDNLDVFSQDIASDSSDLDWSFSFTGMGLPTFLISTSPVIGRAFKINIDAPLSSDSFTLRKTSDYAVPHTMRGQRVQMTYDYLSDVDQGGIAWEIVDQTNSVVIVPESAQQAKPAPSGVVTKGFIFFDIPLNCETLRMTLKRPSGAPFTNSKVFWFNNLELKKYQMIINPIRPAIGTIQEFAGPVASIPYGFLHCNGAAVSRSTYAKLFAVIGTTYGTGDGSTTFNLPNSQGISLRGVGSQTFGSKTYTATLGQKRNDAFAAHNHIHAWGDNSSRGRYGGVNTGVSPGYYEPGASGGGTWGSYTSTTGSGTETNGADLAVTHMICFDDGPARYADYTLNQDYSTYAHRDTTQSLAPNNSAIKILLNSTANASGRGYDTSNSFDATNSRIYAKTNGKYNIIGSVSAFGSNVLAASYYAQIWVNGVFVGRGAYVFPTVGAEFCAQASIEVDLKTGDYVELYLFGSGNNSVNQLSLNSGTGSTYLIVNKLATSQQLFAPIGPVACRYEGNSGQSITSAGTDLTFLNKVVDTHGMFNPTTGVFTCMEDGLYNFMFKYVVSVNLTTSQRATGIFYLDTGGGYTAIHDAQRQNGVGASTTFSVEGILLSYPLKVGNKVKAVAISDVTTTCSVINGAVNFSAQKV